MLSRTVLVLASSLALSAPQQEAFRVEPDPQNVVASRIQGVWEPDKELAERLGTAARVSSYEFESDATVAGRIPAMYEEYLGKMQIFQAGTMTMRRGEATVEKFPYILVANHGNPHVIVFRERDGDAMGDTESFNLALVPAKKEADDLLFIGGDFNNEPFKAYKRAEKGTR